jgi:CRP/FNR family transcriptional regulator, cyclic AMP receptor protein
MARVTDDGGPDWPPGSFLERITAEERDELLALGVTRHLTTGRKLLVEGKPDTHVEVIRKGYVKVTSSTDGVSRLLVIRGPGDLVGELAAVTGNPRLATVTTSGAVVSTIIRQQDFLRFIGRHPNVANQVTAMVGEQLRWANSRRSDYAAYPVHIRLARVLAAIAARCGEPTADGILIGVSLNQTELATLVGAAEDTVQKALRALRERGLIRTGYRRITVLDPHGLLALHHEAGSS